MRKATSSPANKPSSDKSTTSTTAHRSHLQLLQDPEGAYAKLIKLQDVTGIDSRQHGSEDQDKSDLVMELSSLSQEYKDGVPTHVSVPTVKFMEIKTEKTSEKPPKVPLRRLACLNKPEIPVLIFGAISFIVNGAILPVFSILMSSMIKTFYEQPHQMKTDSKFWAFMYIVLGVVSFVVSPARSYLLSVAGSKPITRTRSLSFEKVINMQVGWFDKPENSSAVIGARLSADTASVCGLVGDALALLIQDLSSAAVGLAIAFSACRQLALIILALIPLMSANGYVQVKF